MPSGFSIDPALGLIISRGWGVTPPHDSRVHYAALLADPRFRPHFDRIIDMRDVTVLGVSNAELHDVAERSVFTARSRLALIAASAESYGVARVVQSIRGSAEETTKVFRTLDEALDWLGLSEHRALVEEELRGITALPGTEG